MRLLYKFNIFKKCEEVNKMNNYGVKLDSLDDALIDIQQGKPIILMDNPGREGEGDFLVSAAKITPTTMKFVLDNAKGAFIAIFMPEDYATQFGLPGQVDASDNQESSQTNFRLTTDTLYGHSGCSAAERAQTANILGGRFVPYQTGENGRPFDYSRLVSGELEERASTPEDLVRPGHLVPIAGNPQGLYARQGHTESGIELMKLAGINPPVVVDMEILHPDDPYKMASPAQLRGLADQYDLKVISISQICDRLGVEEKKF